MIDNIKEYTATQLRSLRAEKNYTIEEVAKITGLDKNTISRYENGKNKMQLDVLDKLLSCYEISYSIFFTRSYANNHNLN